MRNFRWYRRFCGGYWEKIVTRYGIFWDQNALHLKKHLQSKNRDQRFTEHRIYDVLRSEDWGEVYY